MTVLYRSKQNTNWVIRGFTEGYIFSTGNGIRIKQSILDKAMLAWMKTRMNMYTLGEDIVKIVLCSL